jgi:hypothetical protein
MYVCGSTGILGRRNGPAIGTARPLLTTVLGVAGEPL